MIDLPSLQAERTPTPLYSHSAGVRQPIPATAGVILGGMTVRGALGGMILSTYDEFRFFRTFSPAVAAFSHFPPR